MKKIIVTILLITATNLASIATNTLPTVYVIATGGTIAGSGNTGTTTSYQPGVLTVGDMLKSVPEIADIANIVYHSVRD